MRSKKRSLIYLILLTFIVIGLFIALLYRIQVRANREGAYQSSELLIDQVKTIIETNDEKVLSLTGSLRDDYVTRAKAVSYIIDKNPKIIKQFTELIWLTNLFSIDEILVINPQGRVMAGTRSEHNNDNINSDSSIFHVFSKMLTEKNFSMCETITDPKDDKQMMYAVCWNASHKRLIMVGVEPTRLLTELASASVDEVVKDIPAYEGVEIFVAENSTGKIVGATHKSYTGTTLSELGLDPADIDPNTISHQSATISGEDSYCSLNEFEKYTIVISQYKSVINSNIPAPLLVVVLYMLIAAVIIIFIVKRMTRRIINEHKNANSDAMTSFSNRRAYETDIRRYDKGEYEPTLVYVSMDLNGLKHVNDTFGHEAGDKLIVGAAECMQRCFGNYGELYRIGGDEFAGLIFADEDRLILIKYDFAEELSNWSDEHDMNLTVSCGYVRASDHTDMSFAQIAKLADDRMYDAKDEYYKRTGITRR